MAKPDSAKEASRPSGDHRREQKTLGGIRTDRLILPAVEAGHLPVGNEFQPPGSNNQRESRSDVQRPLGSRET